MKKSEIHMLISIVWGSLFVIALISYIVEKVAEKKSTKVGASDFKVFCIGFGVLTGIVHLITWASGSFDGLKE